MSENTLLAFHEWLANIAWRVHALVRNPAVLERFHEQIWRWYLGVKSRDFENEVFERRCDEHKYTILADPRLRDKTAGPPQPEWKWWPASRLIRVRDDVGSQDQMLDIEGWAPPDLVYSEPTNYRLLPLTKRELQSEEKYTLLAALHNHFCMGVKRIDLRPERDSDAESVRDVPEDNEYVVLYHCDVLTRLKPEDRPAIEVFLADVEVDLRTAAGKLVQEPSDAGQPAAEGEGEEGAGGGASQTEIQLPARQLPQASDKSAAGEIISGGNDAWLTPTDIAKRFDFDRESLRKRLDRYRAKHHDCYREVAESDRKPRESRYLYRLSSVESVIAQLKKASGETSGERPAKKT